MNYTISNDKLTVIISTLGAELQSIKKDNVEYLWQGDEKSWKSRASNIFPYVGRTTNGVYTYNDNTYSMGTHGFSRHSEFLPNEISDNKIEFLLKSTDETYKNYPFNFNFYIIYEIKENNLFITFKVVNTDNKTMYFGLGGHPGFITPLEEGLTLDDYYIQFDDIACPNNYYVHKESCLIDYKSPYPLENDKILRLKHSLFDNDALIFENMAKSLTLKSDKSKRSVSVKYDDMDYLGIWQSPKLSPNFICIEPWTSLPSKHGLVEDLETQNNLVSLDAQNEYLNTWTITIN